MILPAGQPLPPTVPITPENAAQIREIACWGQDATQQVAFSPDGEWLALGSYSGVALFATRTWREIVILEPHEAVRQIGFLTDSSAVVGWLKDGSIRCWRTTDGILLDPSTLAGVPAPSPAIGTPQLIPAPGGPTRAVVIWGYQRPVELRSVADNQYIRTITHWLGGIPALAFTPDGKIFVAGSGYAGLEGGWVSSWRVADGHLQYHRAEGGLYTRGIAMHPTGAWFASVGADGPSHLWDTERGQMVQSFEFMNLQSITFSPDGFLLAGGAEDGTVQVWRAADGRLLARLQLENGDVESVCFSPDNRFLAAGSSNGLVRLWTTADWSNTDAGIVTIGDPEEGRHSLESRDTHNPLPYAILGAAGDNASVGDLAFTPDSSLIVVGRSDGLLQIWHIPTLRLLYDWNFQGQDLNRVTLSPDGQLLVAGIMLRRTRDEAIYVWRVSDGSLVVHLTGTELWVRSLAFSPDGRLLVSGGANGLIRVWGTPLDN